MAFEFKGSRSIQGFFLSVRVSVITLLQCRNLSTDCFDGSVRICIPWNVIRKHSKYVPIVCMFCLQLLSLCTLSSVV